MALYDVLSTSLTDPLHLTLGILSISLPLLWYLRRGKQTQEQAQSNAPRSWPFNPASLDRKEVFLPFLAIHAFSRKRKYRLIDKISCLTSLKARFSPSETPLFSLIATLMRYETMTFSASGMAWRRCVFPRTAANEQLIDTWLGFPHHSPRPGSHVHRNIP